jgi:hypothetical protein
LIAAYISTLFHPFTSQKQTVALISNLLNLTNDTIGQELSKCKSVTIINTVLAKGDYLQALGVEDKAKGFVTPSGFPSLPGKPSDKSVTYLNPKNAFAGASMILFSLGKEYNPQNEKGALENRPKALMGQFAMSDDEFTSAPGKPDGPSIKTLGQIYAAFNIYTEVRSAIVRTFLAIYRSGEHVTPDMGLMMVSMKMLENAQMTHVVTIQNMLSAHPWLVKVPSLRPSIKEYALELKRFALLPATVRGHIRLIETGSNVYFPSSKMRPLVAVAVDLQKDIEESMKNYVGGQNQYTDLLAEVRQYKEGFRMEQGVDSLASILDLPDVPLPKMSVGHTVTPAPSTAT